MKLAEALLLKSDLRKRIEQLRLRLVKNALAQEGDLPGEDPKSLLVELDQLLIELENLTNQIYEVNHKTITELEISLADLIVQKEQMSLKLRHYNDMAFRVGYKKNLFNNKKSCPVQLHAEVGRLTQEVQDLDLILQKYNWSIEI